jgi:transcriptional regulator with XRE-family HTH domain
VPRDCPAHIPKPWELARLIDLRVARRIRERRLSLGMTQQRLAEIIGVTFQQAHKYERSLSRISAGRLYHIAAALRAPIAYFFVPEEEDDTQQEAANDD